MRRDVALVYFEGSPPTGGFARTDFRPAAGDRQRARQSANTGDLFGAGFSRAFFAFKANVWQLVTSTRAKSLAASCHGPFLPIKTD
ncbi:hypothetical protein C6W91_15880 [Phaeobacter sp. SYSU ZJ3003]